MRLVADLLYRRLTVCGSEFSVEEFVEGGEYGLGSVAVEANRVMEE